MEFKNAITVCLISFFSAALVVLIARSLDSQAASKLQPELAKISKELQAIRAQLAGEAVPPTASVISDGLIVCYAHSNTRCPDCRNLEQQAHETTMTDFADELRDGKIAWQILNYEEPEGTFLVTDYGVQTPTVVLMRMEDGEVVEGKNLDESFALIKGPKEKFIEYLQKEVQAMLQKEDSAEDSADASIDVPLPTP